MRYPIHLIAIGAALVATPSVAQVNVGVGGQGGANFGVGVGGQGGANVGVGVGGQGGANVGVGVGGQGGANVGLGGQGGANVGLGGQAGGNIGGNVGGVADGLTGTLDRSVGTVDRTVNGTLQSDLRLATAADLRAGAAVSDNRGRRVGVLQSVRGSMAVVVSGNKMLHVPLASLYRSAKGLVTRLSKAQLNAAASANANAGANIRN